jgi:hypothetical protein
MDGIFIAPSLILRHTITFWHLISNDTTTGSLESLTVSA